jgi:hypothetical protein
MTQDAKMKKYVVWWTYTANFCAPIIVDAPSHWDAFGYAFTDYAKLDHPDFKKYTVKIVKATDLKEV